MKKIALAILLLAACVAAGILLWQRASIEQVPEACQLVSTDTLLLVEFPDLPASAIRWKETALCQILNEPRVQEFLAKPKTALNANSAWNEAWQSLVRSEPQRVFFAVDNIVNNMPHVVSGIAYNGDRREMEKLVAQARKQLQAATPGGKLERQEYQGFEIETFRANGIMLAGCFARKWYLVSNQVDLLKETLDHLTGKTVAVLATNPTYAQCQKQLPLHRDFTLFSQSGAISNKLLADVNAAGREPGPQESPSSRIAQAVAVSTRMEGLHLHDTLYLYMPDSPKRPELNSKTMGLTNTNTLFYAAMAPLLSENNAKQNHLPFGPGILRMRTLLAEMTFPQTTMAEFKNAFGPEYAVLLDWTADVPQPSLFLASEIRDPTGARHFMEKVFHAWNRVESNGISYWTLNTNGSDMAQFHPSIALTPQHLLAGMSEESLKPFALNAAHLSVNDGALEKNADFLAAMASVGKPQIGLAYLNAKPFFERVYTVLRPAAMLWGNSITHWGKSVDFNKTPPTPAISNHLSPIALSARETDSGILMESCGPVTFLEIGAGMGIAVLSIALPNVQNGSDQNHGNLGSFPRIPTAPLSIPNPTPPFK